MYFENWKYTFKHKIQIYKMYKQYNTKVSLFRVIMHDLDKLFLYLFLPKLLVHKIHTKCIRHHNPKNYDDFSEQYLDWASARFTKPDKPLDAIEVAEKYHPFRLTLAKNHYKEVKFK